MAKKIVLYIIIYMAGISTGLFSVGVYIRVVQHFSFKERFENGRINCHENGWNKAKTLFLKHRNIINKIINKDTKSE